MEEEEQTLFYHNIKIDNRINNSIIKYITYEDYIREKGIIKLEEESKEYELEYPEKEIYNKKRIQKIDKVHDKMIKKILGIKSEMADFLNQFLELKETIKEEKLEECPTEFITKNYKEKHSDIIYRLKDEPIYFLIEHQSTEDKNMIERIYMYVEEIMKKGIEQGKYPIVVPIVIYTGKSIWNTETTLGEKQYNTELYKEYKNNLKYNLIEAKNYTYRELLEKKTLFASFMIIEKCKTKEQLISKLKEIVKNLKENKNKKILEEIIVNIIMPIIGKDEEKEILEKIREREEIDMSPLTKMLLDLEYKGKKEGKKETVKNMLKFNEPEDKIIKYTGISKKELKNIKENLI